MLILLKSARPVILPGQIRRRTRNALQEIWRAKHVCGLDRALREQARAVGVLETPADDVRLRVANDRLGLLAAPEARKVSTTTPYGTDRLSRSAQQSERQPHSH